MMFHVIYSRCSWHFLALGPIFLGLGAGLLYTVDTASSSAKIAGFQILLGVGTGMGVQNTLLAIQYVHLFADWLTALHINLRWQN